MESIIASDVQSFLFSNSLISDHQFGLCPSLSTLDMLLIFSQQCLKSLNLKQEVRTVSQDISQAFNTICHPALLAKLLACGTEGCFNSWISWLPSLMQSTSFYKWNPLLSSSSGGCKFPKALFLVPVLFLFCLHISLNDLSSALETPLFLFADRSTLCHTVAHPIQGKLQLHHSLLIWNWWDGGFINDTCHSIMEHLTVSPYHY